MKLHDMTLTLDRMRMNSKGFYEAQGLESYREEVEASEQTMKILQALQLAGAKTVSGALSLLYGFPELVRSHKVMQKLSQEYSQTVRRLERENKILLSLARTFEIALNAVDDSALEKMQLSEKDKRAFAEAIIPGLEGLQELFKEADKKEGTGNEH